MGTWSGGRGPDGPGKSKKNRRGALTYSRIIGTGSYLPEKVLTNKDLEEFVDTSDEWIRERTGIEQRHMAADGETTCDISEKAARLAMEAAGVGPEDIDVAQLQDTESGAEIMHMSENGFCADGDQEQWLAEGRTEIDGQLPVNTDGGCIANGEPIGASGLRQVYEIALQLRGGAGKRQVPNDPKVGYTHVYGAPGLSGVTILSR